MITTQNIAPLERDVLRLMEEKKVPGLSLAVIENAEVKWHGFGVTNSETKQPIAETTLFEAASLSKPVFAYGVLQMVEDGLLDLDTPLIAYHPYPDVRDDERLKVITARMVLAHTTGFPNWRPKDAALKILFQPGHRFSYSGEGYVFLQKVLENLSGQSLEAYISKNVFTPLAMTQSTFMWLHESQKASGHNSEGIPVMNQRQVPENAAFTLHTTVADYAKFVIAMMKGQGLKPNTIQQMFTPQIRVEEGSVESIENSTGRLSDSISWGLGWGLEKTSQGDSFWHWGDNGGFHSYITGSKAENKAVIIFTNSAKGLIIIPEILSKITGNRLKAFDWLNYQ
jgi:CubicO group peptidase (beta-lactamase class C family)